jgi:hypothetical protein
VSCQPSLVKHIKPSQICCQICCQRFDGKENVQTSVRTRSTYLYGRGFVSDKIQKRSDTLVINQSVSSQVSTLSDPGLLSTGPTYTTRICNSEHNTYHRYESLTPRAPQPLVHMQSGRTSHVDVVLIAEHAPSECSEYRYVTLLHRSNQAHHSASNTAKFVA